LGPAVGIAMARFDDVLAHVEHRVEIDAARVAAVLRVARVSARRGRVRRAGCDDRCSCRSGRRRAVASKAKALDNARFDQT
jgi:hypothetical protein